MRYMVGGRLGIRSQYSSKALNQELRTMKITDGEGRIGEEIEFAYKRPDLPDCQRCENGTKCNCAVYAVSDIPEGITCACMGFLNCPECPRERSGLIMFG